ncbi:Ig-like domain-containing protein [Clostridium cellulovorans]|uniref:Ig domain protein group 2 domain protein n=1 Tax=Clostridium cellulovorans (strain ATCC 35296 / DSM 3052 / OCM 3 / 743B) TaxID=573061 RepID=D9STT8_CLOC7|nr:Ig-like domain-containing protein [Clostridium cellulovorans]ADL50776.1 Ig domain protein group 2 domain protein [Clostridium cellulovorans 743B]
MKNKRFKKLRNSLIAVMSIAVLVLASSNIFATSTVGATTWDPANKASNVTLSNDNLTTAFGGNVGNVKATNYKISGKWYWELKIISSSCELVGVANELFNVTKDNGTSNNQLSYYGYGSTIYPGIKGYGESFAGGDIISIALDIDNKKIRFAKNGKWFSDINLPAWNQYYPFVTFGSSSGGGVQTTNFGASPFAYQAPVGFSPFDNTPIETASTSISLNKSTTNLNVEETESLVATITPSEATNKNIIWTSSDTAIATVDTAGKITAIKEGQATIIAKIENTDITATCIVDVTATKETVTVESEKTKIPANQEFTTDIVLHNAKDTFAEDVKINYDKDLFEYVGYEDIEGLKVYKEIKNPETGDLRFIIASQGETNGINADKTLVKLKFKTKGSGKGKVDVIATRIADNAGTENDLLTENCGEKEFEVFTDVNNTGDFTLGDLAIDGYYYGKNVSDTDKVKYNADVVVNEKIDDEDLTEITSQIIGNSKYTPNN